MRTPFFFFGLITTAMSILFHNVYAQQVEREMVVMEVSTANWCVHCPGAAQGAEDMVTAGHDVAVILNHVGDAFANTYSNARIAYYDLSGHPTAKFDGVRTTTGGKACPVPPSLYETYLAQYNIRKAIPSSFTLGMEGTGICNHFDMTVAVQKVAEATIDNCVVQLVLTESNIASTWFCMTECNFVNRLMVPNQFGTPLNLTDNQQTIDLSFDIYPSWDAYQCELVAFIQNNTTKEIYQAIKVPLDDFIEAALCDTVTLSPGWRGLSSTVDPLNDTLEWLFAPIQDEMAVLLENGNIYWPSEDINTIMTWDPLEGYILKMDEEADLVFVGNLTIDSTFSLAAGWNVIPVLSDVQVETEALFLPVAGYLTMVKEIGGGGIYWPAMNINTLPFLLPRNAYQVLVFCPCSITF